MIDPVHGRVSLTWIKPVFLEKVAEAGTSNEGSLARIHSRNRTMHIMTHCDAPPLGRPFDTLDRGVDRGIGQIAQRRSLPMIVLKPPIERTDGNIADASVPQQSSPDIQWRMPLQGDVRNHTDRIGYRSHRRSHRF